jgi:hypothetical protein
MAEAGDDAADDGVEAGGVAATGEHTDPADLLRHRHPNEYSVRRPTADGRWLMTDGR